MAVTVVAGLLVAACGGGDGAAGPVTADDVQDVPQAAPIDDQSVESDTASAAAAFSTVFATSTPLGGAAFDGAALAGTDTVMWFWAPWCTICRAEGPGVADVAERFDGQIEIVGVAGRGEIDDMDEFVGDTETGALTHVADLDGSIWNAFGVYAQPAFAFIDDTGDIEVFVGGLGEAGLTERIDELLAT